MNNVYKYDGSKKKKAGSINKNIVETLILVGAKALPGRRKSVVKKFIKTHKKMFSTTRMYDVECVLQKRTIYKRRNKK